MDCLPGKKSGRCIKRGGCCGEVAVSGGSIVIRCDNIIIDLPHSLLYPVVVVLDPLGPLSSLEH